MAAVDVLLVDDDDATRDGLRELLTLNGFSVDTAQDGQQALDTIRRHSVGVVLLDVNLPGVDDATKQKLQSGTLTAAWLDYDWGLNRK